MKKVGVAISKQIITYRFLPALTLVNKNQVFRTYSFSKTNATPGIIDYSKSTPTVGKAFMKNRTFSTRSESCWKCDYKYDISETDSVTFKCPKCNSLWKINAENMPNYFDLLNIPRTYQIDITDVTNQAKRLQKKFHPDLFSQSGEVEQEISQEMSSLVNKAQSTLSNPIERGYYLLKLSGMDISSDVEKETTSDPKFLGEVMELNEKLEEISTEAEWRKFRDENEMQLKNLQKDLGEAFNQKRLKEARFVIARMKYFDTLQMKLKDLQSKIGVVE